MKEHFVANYSFWVSAPIEPMPVRQLNDFYFLAILAMLCEFNEIIGCVLILGIEVQGKICELRTRKAWKAVLQTCELIGAGFALQANCHNMFGELCQAFCKRWKGCQALVESVESEAQLQQQQQQQQLQTLPLLRRLGYDGLGTKAGAVGLSNLEPICTMLTMSLGESFGSLESLPNASMWCGRVESTFDDFQTPPPPCQ